MFLVEPQLFDLMDHPDITRRDLSSLSVLTHIGAAAAPVLRMRARERFGPVIAHTYGASEMGIVSALTPPEHDLAHPGRFTCAGRIVPDVDVRFRFPDGTLDERSGAIEVRSPAMASGYLRRPVEQAMNFTDGWYRSGDLGELDDEGYLHIHGRVVDCAEIGCRRHRMPRHDPRDVRPVGGISSGSKARGPDPSHRAGEAEPPRGSPARPRACGP